jgi:hypothetical protein
VRIAVLGTGVVGRTLGGKLVELGHEVRMGSRAPDNEGMEMYLPLWLRMMATFGTPGFNIHVAH